MIQELKQVAKESGRSMSQPAINWIRQRPDLQMIPILGARTQAQLEDTLACLEWLLSAD